MKKLKYLLILPFLLGSISSFSQSEKSKKVEIEFKNKYQRENFDVVKFFLVGTINSENASLIEKNINSTEGISNFKIREIKTGECIAEISKEMSADNFRVILKKHYLDFNRNSIKILSKTYFTY